VGIRNLETALSLTPLAKATVDWKAFYLNSSIPDEGEDLYEHIKNKYGKDIADKMNSPESPLVAAGQKVGITFNPNRRVINTTNPHRVMIFLHENGYEALERKFMDILFAEYFEQGRDVSKLDILEECLGQLGDSVIDMDKFKAEMSTGKYTADVTASDRLAKYKYKVSGVPFFIITNNRPGETPVGLSGAQPPHVLKQVIDEMME
jgi:predicted DsbA family dithiol-disulfide isomerase